MNLAADMQPLLPDPIGTDAIAIISTPRVRWIGPEVVISSSRSLGHIIVQSTSGGAILRQQISVATGRTRTGSVCHGPKYVWQS